jgi:hypothetical protein
MAPAGLLHPQTDVALELVEGDIFNGQYRPNASDRRLFPEERISAVWPEQPSYDNLHVFITPPPGGERITFVTPPLSTHVGFSPSGETPTLIGECFVFVLARDI